MLNLQREQGTHNAAFSNGMLAADGGRRGHLGTLNTLCCVSLSVTLKSFNLPLLCWNEIIRWFWLDLCSIKDKTGESTALQGHKSNTGMPSVALVILITVEVKKKNGKFCSINNEKGKVCTLLAALEGIYV